MGKMRRAFAWRHAALFLRMVRKEREDFAFTLTNKIVKLSNIQRLLNTELRMNITKCVTKGITVGVLKAILMKGIEVDVGENGVQSD